MGETEGVTAAPPARRGTDNTRKLLEVGGAGLRSPTPALLVPTGRTKCAP
jgi:hypothetical protein